MASGSDGGRDYSLVELFAVKFVVADVLIIAALLLAGPLYALAITALFVLSTFLIWHLMQREDESDAEASVESDDADETDPVTTLQERYAAGDLSDDEFEAKLERLIDANERAASSGVETEDLELDLDLERSR